MKLLLDENLPKRLKLDFTEHEIYTVRDKGWNGIKNGQLLKLLIENQFDALFTFDKNLSYQQEFPLMQLYNLKDLIILLSRQLRTKMVLHFSYCKSHEVENKMDILLLNCLQI